MDCKSASKSSSSTPSVEETEAVLWEAVAPVSAGPAFLPAPRDRRFSISAEPYTPTIGGTFPDGETGPDPSKQPKDEKIRTSIKEAVRPNLLFRNLDEEQLDKIIDAMVERRVPRDVQLIRQGEEGDYFYVVAAGSFVVEKDGVEVVRYGPGDAFGELALMYGSPRLATVRALEDSVVWAVDRHTFRSIVIDLAYRKRRLYERFLRSVPLLATLHDGEICRICDALQPVHFSPGAIIVRQGEMGHQFYIVEEGEAQVTMSKPNDNEDDRATNANSSSENNVEVGKLKTGDYFGELALLRDAPRAATVTAITPVKCVTLTKADFIRLLGPVMPILQRNQEHYRKYEEFLS